MAVGTHNIKSVYQVYPLTRKTARRGPALLYCHTALMWPTRITT